MLDGVFERHLLEGVQRVVMDEDADRSLRRQQMRQTVDQVRERMVGVGWVATMGHHGGLTRRLDYTLRVAPTGSPRARATRVPTAAFVSSPCGADPGASHCAGIARDASTS